MELEQAIPNIAPALNDNSGDTDVNNLTFSLHNNVVRLSTESCEGRELVGSSGTWYYPFYCMVIASYCVLEY